MNPLSLIHMTSATMEKFEFTTMTTNFKEQLQDGCGQKTHVMHAWVDGGGKTKTEYCEWTGNLHYYLDNHSLHIYCREV